ncbi:MAG: carbohydrate porin [Verrucomicrobia bacterium]|nr:carbohydrate porin [Verrucomicrobiota bacterium]
MDPFPIPRPTSPAWRGTDSPRSQPRYRAPTATGFCFSGWSDQGNYIDSNSYANNSQTQFLNDALVNNATIPLPEANLGFNLQWQPTRQFYLLMGAGSNLQIPKQAVVLSLGAANWSYLLELGLITTNTFGLGPGIYRVQPFVATVHSDTQGGVGLNFQQDLGIHTPIAAFGRLGVCGNQIAFENIRAQGSLGLAPTGPIDAPGPIPLFSNDMLGLAFVWSQAVPDGFPVYRPNEYNIELFYSVQITPTLKLQPDLQVFWDAADRPQSGVSLLWQLQLTLTW